MSNAKRPRKHSAIEILESRVLLSASLLKQIKASPTYILAKTDANPAQANAALFAAAPSVSPAASPPAAMLLNPAQMQQAYGVNNIVFGSTVGNGTGETIAIVDAYRDPNASSNLATFDGQFGLSAPPSFTQKSETGGSDSSVPTDSTGGWEVEESLDIEWAHSIAPDANIILYEANSASYSDLLTAVVTAAKNSNVSVVSMSWGGGEFSGETSYDSDFTTPSSRASSGGVTFVASTGDSAAPAGYPAYSPNVVAVGGTTLLVSDTAGDYYSESGWSDGGGGTSTQEAEPNYQKSVQSSGFRDAPDVSMDADPNSGVYVYDTFDESGWLGVGGTSLASPMFAALVAIADQGRAHYGLKSLDGPSQTLPDLYTLPSTINFHDITTGSNGFSAGPGYDLVTGIGSPIANQLIPNLVQPDITSFVASPNPVTAGNTLTLTATTSDVSGTISTVAFYRESNGTSGLQTGTGGDTFLGDGTFSSNAWTLPTSTTGLSGSQTYYAVATDSNSVSSPIVTATAIVNSASAGALFILSDTATQGTWNGMYGSDGYDAFGGNAALPSYAQVSESGAQTYVWNANTSDTRGLQYTAASTNRFAACYYASNSFSLNVNLTDSATHEVGLYLLDWDGRGRSENIQISSGSTILDTRTVNNFGSGKWLVWNMSGDVTITISYLGGLNVVASGLFFAPSVSPAIAGAASFLLNDTATEGTWNGTYGSDGYELFGGSANLPSYAQVTISGSQSYAWSNNTSDTRGLQNSYSSTNRTAACDFSSNSFTINVDLTDSATHEVALYLLDWDGRGRDETVQVSADGSLLDARTVSSFGNGVWLAWNVSGDVNISISYLGGLNVVASGIFFGPAASAPAAGTASFVQSDTTTAGTWTNTYGADGYDIFGSSSSLPSYAQVTSSGSGTYVWNTNTTDSRALQTSSGSSTRIASCDFASNSFTINVNMSGTATHELAMYFLDWDGRDRSETVQVSADGTLLDSRSVSNFGNGAWLDWNVSGDVTITVSYVGGLNIVASGLFFGPAAP